MKLDFELRLFQHSVDRESGEFERQQVKRTFIADTKNCYSGSLEIIHFVNSKQFVLFDFIHELNDSFSASVSLVVDFDTIDVEPKSRVAIDTDILRNFLFILHINCSNNVLRVLFFEFLSQSLVLGSKSDAVTTSRRIVLYKDELVVLKSRVIGLFSQLDNVLVLDLLRLIFFLLLSTVELLNDTFFDVTQEFSQRLFYIELQVLVLETSSGTFHPFLIP